MGALVMLVAVQVSVPGSYLPPVLKEAQLKFCRVSLRPRRSFGCQSTPPCERPRAAGAPVVLVAVQLFVLGLYLPPVFKKEEGLQGCKSAPDYHFAAGPDCGVSIRG